MTDLAALSFTETSLDGLADTGGAIAVIATPDGKLDRVGRRLSTLSRKAVARLLDSPRWTKAKPGEVVTLEMPGGLAADRVLVACLSRRASVAEARKAGAAIAAARGKGTLLVALGNQSRAEEVVLGLLLRDYRFTAHKTGDDDGSGPEPITVMVDDPAALEAAAGPVRALAEGVFFTRDLVNEPANVLTTSEFAHRLTEMTELGLKVTVLEEGELEKLGMGCLLAVGQGSDSPSKVVVMEWQGAGDEKPLALVGKGVVFDTGGISLKPGQGMEDMTMDMGGAGVVAGVMRALARRKARANVVGLVGLVENMPSGRATRPGDVVRSMKGDTVEVINTDAEGRLVLADVMWYAQETFQPAAMVDLATLTGAIIVALGEEKAGVFSNDDGFCGALLKAAEAEGEGAWRMPLGEAYDKLLKSRVADMKNVGGRAAGSITAAQFLQRFVKEGCPWVHLDIAGVTSPKSDTALAPKGATGWGVLTLDRLVRDRFETASD